MVDLTDLGQKHATGMGHSASAHKSDEAKQKDKRTKEPDGFFTTLDDLGQKDAKGVGKGR